MDVLLVRPPFFRLVGSHNSKVPVQLSYLSAHLRDAKIEHAVLNLDHTEANRFWRWWKLYENTDMLRAAVDGHSPLAFDSIERIVSLNPKLVVLEAGDNVLPTVDVGNAWFTAQLSMRLRMMGIKTVGVGSFYTSMPEKFLSSFDALLVGGPNSNIVSCLQLVRDGAGGLIEMGKMDPTRIPNLQDLLPAGQDDSSVMSSFGCSWGCEFCLMPKLCNKFVFADPEEFARDIGQRKARKLYIGDMVFPVSTGRLEKIRDSLAAHHQMNISGREYTCESRCDTLTEEKAVLLKEIGVKRVKIGIENINEEMLKKMGKRQNLEKAEKGLQILKDHGLGVVVYVLLGGEKYTPKIYEENYRFFSQVRSEVEYLVVNVWSYVGDDCKYDAHFSKVSLDRWEIPEWEFERFCGLQEGTNPTIGKLLG